MPKYDYRCETCGEIEIEHKMDEKSETCPNCSGPIKMIFTSPGITFVGEGWTPKHYNK